MKSKPNYKHIKETISGLNDGTVCIAEPLKKGGWKINKGVIDTIFKYFEHKKRFVFPDFQAKKDLTKKGVRKLDGSFVRYGAHIGNRVVLMPSLVNIGARVGDNTTIDTWATIGSGAHIGSNVHISGGVGIGGILEPRQDAPVIIEDNCFIGSRSIIVEGVHIGKGSVIAANSVITQSTRIYNSIGGKLKEMPKGIIPPGVVVIPASYKTKTGLYRPCVEIIAYVSEETKRKVGINTLLRKKKTRNK